ncbi:MAG TPA: PA14 domain-containing protein [Pyrinomonadaceae bacterium]
MLSLLLALLLMAQPHVAMAAGITAPAAAPPRTLTVVAMFASNLALIFSTLAKSTKDALGSVVGPLVVGRPGGNVYVSGDAAVISPKPPNISDGGRLLGAVRAGAFALPEDIPASVPAPRGTRVINVNTPEDLSLIDDWATVADLNVAAEGLVIDVPPGDYRRLELRAASRLNFTGGVYNFAEGVSVVGGIVESTGKVTLNVGQSLDARGGGLALGAETVPGDVRVNVLGPTVGVSEGAQVAALLRAPNATVEIGSGASLLGQVIAGELRLAGGLVQASTGTQAGVSTSFFGPRRFDRKAGQPVTETERFTLPPNTVGPFTLTVQNGEPGGANRVSSATIKLNGAEIFKQSDFNQNVPSLARTVTLAASNTLEVKLASSPGSFIIINVKGTRLDKTPPLLAVNTPADGLTTTDATLALVGGTASDPGTDATGIANVFVGDSPAVHDAATGKWTLANVPLKLGANPIRVRAVDRAGNQTTAELNVTRREPPRDTVAPALAITSPADGFKTRDESISVGGTVSDAGTPATGVSQVTVNGVTAALDKDAGTWSLASVALAIGDNTLTARALDAAGNETTKSITVRREQTPRDTLPPVVSVTSPQDNAVVAEATVTLSGTATDEGEGATGVRRVLVGEREAAYDASTRRWTLSGVALEEGPNSITVAALDGAPTPNRGETTTRITRRTPDTQQPSVQITSPSSGSETVAGTVDVTGTANDEGPNASGVGQVLVNGKVAVYDPLSRQWTANAVPLAYGDNALTAVVTDAAQPPNESRAEVRVKRLKPAPPALTVTNPRASSVLGSTVVTVAGSVTSGAPGEPAVTVNGRSAAVSGGQYTLAFELKGGVNDIEVVAIDSLGQQSRAGVSVTRDASPPTVSFREPPTVVNPGASYPVLVEATDDVAVAGVEFFINGRRVGSDNEAPYLFTLDVPAALAAGNRIELTAVARDLTDATAAVVAEARTTGPGGVSGHAFDDATGYVLEGVAASLGTRAVAAGDASGAFFFVTQDEGGVVRLSKAGYTPVERAYALRPGGAVALFDARLTPLDARANAVGAGDGGAAGDGGRLQVRFGAGSFASETDVRVTSVSPQGLEGLLPYGWSPVPFAVVHVGPAVGASADARTFPVAARLSVARTQGLAEGTPLVFAHYDETRHGWVVLQIGLKAGAGGALEADLPRAGQYAFLVADTGADAPPAPVVGAGLPSSRPADSASLGAATAFAMSAPRAVAYAPDAGTTVSFVADSARALPSGVSVQATFGETYRLLAAGDPLLVERPSQDFILYSYPASSTEHPNRLGAFFVARPTRTDFSITDLVGANVHVELGAARQPKAGSLVGPGGGELRASSGARLRLAADALEQSRPVFFNDVLAEESGLELPEGYQLVAAFDLDLSGAKLKRAAVFEVPATDGESRVVVARAVTLAGRRRLMPVARAEFDAGLLTTRTNAPGGGELFEGANVGGRYFFVRVTRAFGFVKGVARVGGAAAEMVRVSAVETPFVDVTGSDGKFVVVAYVPEAGGQGTGGQASPLIEAASLRADATGQATAAPAARDAVAEADITLAPVPLRVASIAPTDNAQNTPTTAVVSVTFSKPVTPSSLTASSFAVKTTSGEPVAGSLTLLAGNRVAVFTPAATLADATNYRVSLTRAVRDLYDKPLASDFGAAFTTAQPIAIADRLRPEDVRVNYPGADGLARIEIPASRVPEGAEVVVVDNVNGATSSIVAGTGRLTLGILAQVGDELIINVRQPDGVEYKVSQAAYRRADGFTTVGAGGGAVTSDDGRLLLQIPGGALTGQADIRLMPQSESDIPLPRVGELEPSEVPFGGGLLVEARGDFRMSMEAHVELPAPAGSEEGRRVAFLSPAKLNVQGRERDVWQAVTSGKVEGGKFKTTSPPFTGLLLAPGFTRLYAFAPRSFRAVHGVVTERVPGASSKPLAGVLCSIKPTFAPAPAPVTAVSGPDGTFATFELRASTQGGGVAVSAIDATGRTANAVGAASFNYSPYSNPGLIGLGTVYASVEFPPESDSGPERKPALIQINGSRNGLKDGEPDSLKESGLVPVGASVHLFVTTTPAVEVLTSRTVVGGVEGKKEFNWRRLQGAPGTSAWDLDIDVLAEGSYSVVVETYTTEGVPPSRATAAFNFVALRNPNVRPPLPGPPSVLTVTPEDGERQVDAGAILRLDFSEPVKNLVTGQTLFVLDTATGERLGGRLTSGGIAVGAESANISTVVFEPQGLKGGHQYEVNVTTDVVDSDGNRLDQRQGSAAGAAPQPFKSSFKTFTGLVLTKAAVKDPSLRIASAGQYVATVSNPGAGGSFMYLYDVSDPSAPARQSVTLVPQRAIGITLTEVESNAPATATREDAAKRDDNLFTVYSTGKQYARLALITTHALPDQTRATNLRIYSIDDVQSPELIGIVSLSFPSEIAAIPGFVTVHKKRAYVGTVSYGGCFVVDIEKAINQFAKAQQSSTSGLTDPRTLAVAPNSGFARDAKVQSASVGAGPNEPFPVTGVSVIEQQVASPRFDPSGARIRMPVAYVASPARPRLISFGLDASKDNLNGFSDSDGDGKEDRLLADVPLEPVDNVLDVRAVSGVSVNGKSTDLAVVMGYANLWVFDVTIPTAPVLLSSRPFTKLLGEDFGYARRMDVEGTTAYVVFADRVAAFDFADPAQPHHVATLTGVGGNVQWVTVRDGFAYTISSGATARDGINSGIARAASQVITYGVGNEPAGERRICTNPVVISRLRREMQQPAGIFFQVFGHDRPKAAQVVIRKEKPGVPPETLATLAADIDPDTTDGIVIGTARWSDPGLVIDRAAVYTAEVLLDPGGRGAYASKREPIPFSFLISEFNPSLGIEVREVQPDPSKPDLKQKIGTALYNYILAGDANVELQIKGTNRFADAADPQVRSFGLRADPVSFDAFDLPPGVYAFTLRATLADRPGVTDDVEGLVTVGANRSVREPGTTVVNDVEVANGNLALSYNDVSIKNRGLSLSLTRSYNAASADAFGPFGYGWAHNFQVLLSYSLVKGKKEFHLKGGDGGSQLFKEENLFQGRINASGTYYGQLAVNPDGSFDYFTRAQVRYHFPGALQEDTFNFYNAAYMGNLEFMEEPNGNRLTLGYDQMGRMVSVTDSSRRALNFTYELAETPFVGVLPPTAPGSVSCTNKGQFGLIRSRFLKADVGKAYHITNVTGPGDLSIDYAYDAEGNLQSVTRRGSDDISRATSDSVWQYAYNPSPVTATRPELAHLLREVRNPNSTLAEFHGTTYEYHLDQLRTPVAAVRFPEDSTVRYSYTFDAGRVSRTDVSDARGNFTTYTFDDKGHTLRAEGPSFQQTSGLVRPVTEMKWNEKGLLESQTDPEGMTATTIYDDFGNPRYQSMTGRDGVEIETLPEYDIRFSKLASFVDGRGYKTSYDIDQKTGNVSKIVLPTNRVITLEYDPRNGDLKKVLDENGLATLYDYDKYGNATFIQRETTPGGTRVVTKYKYDERSRLVESSGTLAPSVTYDYDALDRVAETVSTDAASFRETLTARYDYYPAGQLKTSSMSGGGQRYDSTLKYDGQDRLVEVEERPNDAPAYKRTYGYDRNSNLTTETDRRGVKTTRTYDALNYLTSTTVSGPFDKNNKVVESPAPDFVGNPTRFTDLHGNVTEMFYDGLHRLKSRKLPGGYTEVFSYDDNGNVISARDRNGRFTTTSYDPVNRPTRQMDPKQRVTTWAYDDATRTVTTTRSPQGLTHVVRTDGLNRTLREEVTFTGADYVSTYVYDGLTVAMTDPRGTLTTRELSSFGQPGRESVSGSDPPWRVEMRYAAFGGLRSTTDANGRDTVYKLDGLGRPVRVDYPGGFNASFTYDGEGEVLSSRDRRGVVTQMTYDNLRRMLTSTTLDADGPIPVLTNVYDDPNSAVTMTDAEGRATTMVYDGLRRPSKVTDPDKKEKSYVYDGLNLTRESDFKGKFSEYTYDELDRLTSFKDRNGNSVVMKYDDSGGLKRTTTDRRGNPRVEVFDPLGRLRSVTHADEPLVSYEYDGNNNRTLMTDARGNRVVYTFDVLDRLRVADHSSGVRVERYDYDAVGNLRSYFDGFGAPVVMQYDELDHLKSSTDGEGNTTVFKFDGEGLPVERIDPKGNDYRTTYGHNALGSLRLVKDAAGGVWRFDYYKDQTLRTMTDALGRTTDYTYDPLRRLRTVAQHAADAPERVTTYGYDANGNRSSMLDARGQLAKTDYDDLDRPSVVLYQQTSGAGPRRQAFTYDPEDNLNTVDESATDVPGSSTRTYRQGFDARDRLTSQTDPYGSNVSYTYDAANNVRTFTDAAGLTTAYDYDPLNRLKRAELPVKTPVAYTYKPDGLVESVAYGAGMTRRYEYDDADRVRSVTNTAGPAQGEVYAYTYDANSNRRTETKSFGGALFRKVGYDYDLIDRLTRVENSGPVNVAAGGGGPRGLKAEYFDDKELTDLKVTRVDATVDFGWPGSDSPDPSIDGETFSARWTGAVRPLYSETYTFHTVTDEGVRLWVDDKLVIDNNAGHTSTEDRGTIELEAGRRYSIRMEFYEGTGDAEAQLLWSSASQTKEVIPQDVLFPPSSANVATTVFASNTLNYSYDAVGNRKTEAGRDALGVAVNRAYKYDDLNQLKLLTGEALGDRAYTYDENGNLTSAARGAQTVNRFEYDARDQLRRVTGGVGEEVARYDYDVWRRRLSKSFIATGVEQRYVYGAGGVADEFDRQNRLVNRYDYGTDLVRSQLGGEGERWHFYDALGSTTALSTAEPQPGGAVAGFATRYEYTHWGELLAGADASANPFGYTGQRLDDETGLMPLGNGERYYSPALGRFIQQDGFAGRPPETQSLNRYAYVANNPLRYVDPSGADGVAADSLKRYANDPRRGYGVNFALSFAAGFTYDTLNVATFGGFGTLDVAVQDLMRGRSVDLRSAFARGGYGASVGQVGSNFVAYGKGVVKGAYNVAMGLPELGYGLITHPLDTAGAIKKGLGDQVLAVFDAAYDPDTALDRLAAAGQENALEGIGEFVGETVAFEGAGRIAGRTLGAVGRTLAETRLGGAVVRSGLGRATAAVYRESIARLGAARAGLHEFERGFWRRAGAGLGRLSQGAGAGLGRLWQRAGAGIDRFINDARRAWEASAEEPVAELALAGGGALEGGMAFPDLLRPIKAIKNYFESRQVGPPGGIVGTPEVFAEFELAGQVFNDVNATARKVRKSGPLPGLSGSSDDQLVMHAEIGAMHQAYEAGLRGGHGILRVSGSRNVCKYCKGDIKSFASDYLNLETLTVFDTDGIVYTFEAKTGDFRIYQDGGKGWKTTKRRRLRP